MAVKLSVRPVTARAKSARAAPGRSATTAGVGQLVAHRVFPVDLSAMHHWAGQARQTVSWILVVLLAPVVWSATGAPQILERDTAYGADPKQRLDLSVP